MHIVLNVLCAIPLVMIVISYMMYSKPKQVVVIAGIGANETKICKIHSCAYWHELNECPTCKWERETGNKSFDPSDYVISPYSAECVDCGYVSMKCNMKDGKCTNCNW